MGEIERNYYNKRSPAPAQLGTKEVQNNFIPLCVPELGGNELEYIKECIDTNFVSSVGPLVGKFEEEFAKYVGAPYAVATVNGTSALHTALIVAGIQPDDEVIMPSLTFIATANAIHYIGARPVFIDSDPDYWQIDPSKIEHFLETECTYKNNALFNKTTGNPVRAIMPVHILGHPCDMDAINDLAARYGLIVIEDATESLGATYKGRKVGTLASIACFSFNGNKLITTGNGGMLVTSNKEWAIKAKYLTTQAKNDPLEFIHGDVGYNYRLSNILAAMGLAQLEQIDLFVQKKKKIAARYTEAFRNVPGLSAMKEAPWAESVFWMFTMLVDKEKYGMDSRGLLTKLDRYNIQTRPLWQPIHLSPAYRHLAPRDCRTAKRLNELALSLPCSVGLTEEEQESVIYRVVNSR